MRYRGVTVGKVENIRLDPEKLQTILIRIAVDRDLPLTKNAYAQLGYQGLTGLAFVQLNDDGGMLNDWLLIRIIQHRFRCALPRWTA